MRWRTFPPALLAVHFLIVGDSKSARGPVTSPPQILQRRLFCVYKEHFWDLQMSKPPPKPAKPGKSDSVTFCVFYSGPKSDVFPLRSTHLVAEGVWVWWAGSCTWKRHLGVSIDRLSKVKIKSVDASTVSLIQKDTEKCPQCCLTGGVRSLVEGLCHFPISITHAATLVSSSGFRSEVQRRWWACRVWMLPVPLPVTKKKPSHTFLCTSKGLERCVS